MEANIQNCNLAKEPVKRIKSVTRYPKNGPTYMVPIVMQDTYDDLMTIQQMIYTKSPPDSITSVTPKISVTTLDSNGIENIAHTIEIPVENNKNNIYNKYGDTKKVIETETVIIKDDNNFMAEMIQPEVIFNATHAKRIKDDNTRKKNRKNKRPTKFRNVYFKCKHSQQMIARKLYHDKSKRHAMASGIIENSLCNLSNIVTRSRILKKVIAVENLLGVDSQHATDDCNSNDGLSSFSSSTTKKGVLCYSSDSTITRKWSSTSSKTEGYTSVNTGDSVIQVSSENVIPYKNDVINVAVAVAFNNTKQSNPFSTRNELMNYVPKEDLTRTETVVLPQVNLTSTAPSYEGSFAEKPKPAQSNNIKDANSNDTLIGNRKKSSMIMSIDENTFLIARTSSDFNKSTDNSNITLTNSETASNETMRGHNDFRRETEYNNQKLLDTVINLGFLPETIQSTSKLNGNTVIITKENKTYPKQEGENTFTKRTDMSKNILQKNFDIERNLAAQKFITLPNEEAIKAKLKENQESQRKANFTFQNNHPSTLSEMWDKIMLVIEAGLKRIEETLPEKIIREIKRAFDFDEYKNFLFKKINDKKELDSAVKEKVMVDKSVCVDMSKTEENLQCDLIENQVIDQLMMKLCPNGPNDVLTAKLSQKLITRIFKEYFEVVTPGSTSDIDLKEELTLSETEPQFTEDVDKFKRLKMLLDVPLRFVKENAFVITSVPTFFIVLLSMYGLVMFIMKPL